jgi:hypothetical protein
MVGRRMPDVDCGGRRLFELLRTGRFVLLVKSVLDADLPGIVCAVHSDPNLPTAVLVRPGMGVGSDARRGEPPYGRRAMDPDR